MIWLKHIALTLAVIFNFVVISLNFFLAVRVDAEINKLSERNVTGRAIALSQLGVMVPLNWSMVGIDLLIIIAEVIQ